jgi:ribosomal protein S18 acetylase RimI-like enzyme
MPALADPSDAMERERRLDAVLTMVQSRLLPLLPGGVVHHTGRALWAMSATTLAGSNGVLRYDARRFRGPDSERELDTCLAVMSTSDLPWTFSVWDHLGGEVLQAELDRRGFVAVSTSTAVWLDLPATVPAPCPGPGTQLRRVVTAEDGRDWAAVHGEVFGAPCARLVEVVRHPSSASLVAVRDGAPVGVVSMARADGVAVIFHCGVLPGARGQGIGRLLVEAACAEVRASGIRACVAMASEAATPLAQSLGAVRTTRVTLMAPGAAGQWMRGAQLS